MVQAVRVVEGVVWIVMVVELVPLLLGWELGIHQLEVGNP